MCVLVILLANGVEKKDETKNTHAGAKKSRWGAIVFENGLQKKVHRSQQNASTHMAHSDACRPGQNITPTFNPKCVVVVVVGWALPFQLIPFTTSPLHSFLPQPSLSLASEMAAVMAVELCEP